MHGVCVSSTKRDTYIYYWIKDWLNTFDVEMNEGLNENLDPSTTYQKPTGGTMAGRVVAHCGFPVSSWNSVSGRRAAIFNHTVRVALSSGRMLLLIMM